MSDLALVELPTLERSLADLEAVVERTFDSFIECGQAMCEIHDRELYRETHRSWDAYCMEKWGLTGRSASRRIEQVKDAELNGTVRPHRVIVEERQALARGETPRRPPEPVLIIAKSHPKTRAYCGPRAVVVIGNAPEPEPAPDLSALAADLLADIEALVPDEPEPVLPVVATLPKTGAFDLLLDLLDLEPEAVADEMTLDAFALWDEWAERLDRHVNETHADWVDRLA